MGNPETMTMGALEKIKECQAIIGAKRMVDSVMNIAAPAECRSHYAILSEEIASWIKNDGSETVAVIMSGDTGFFSGTKKLIDKLNKEDYKVEILPGISSLQYFCSKIQLSWDDVKIISLHGRQANFLNSVRNHEKVFLLTDKQHSPSWICECLVDAALGDAEVFAGERLSYPDEVISSGTAKKMAGNDFDPLSVVLIRNRNYDRKPVVTHGIPDEVFTRGKVPMTKEEVRSVTLSKLQLCRNDVIYDIGAGTGSVSIEMALQASEGCVYAIESNEDAVALIEENKKNMGADNLHVIPGMAPEAMNDLPPADKAFIGGSKGNIDKIIDLLLEKNPNVRIVVNVIAIESLADTIQAFRDRNFEYVDVTQISAARAKELGRYHLMMGQNPVFILTGQKGGSAHDE